MKTVVRPLLEQDLPQVALLIEQLGYPQAEEFFLPRLRKLSATDQHGLFAAVDGERVLGFLHLKREQSFVSAEKAEIKALVIDEIHRGKGVGSDLVNFAKTWAKNVGLDTILVRTNILRDGAHRFYEREGFQLKKTSHLFSVKI